MTNIQVSENTMKDRPIALVVLTYNSLDTTKEFLKLLFENTDKEKYNLFLVDNCSSDDTQSYILDIQSKNENVFVVLSEKNLGVSGGRNLGYHIAKREAPIFDYLLFLDNDQYVSSGWLENHMSIMSHGYDVIGVEAWQMTDYFRPIKRIERIGETFSYVGGGGMMIKREVVEKIGLFDNRYNPLYFEDPDYCFTAYYAGYKIGWNAKSKIEHHPHVTTRSMDKNIVNNAFLNSISKFREKWKGKKPPLLRQLKLPEFE